jgi:hypothetical protein
VPAALKQLQGNPEAEADLDGVEENVHGELTRSEIFNDFVRLFHDFERFHLFPPLQPLVCAHDLRKIMDVQHIQSNHIVKKPPKIKHKTCDWE